MATCKNCFRKYDDRGIRDGLFSSYPNFEFCSSVCASAKKEADEAQRKRESAETSAADYQSRAFDAQQRAQSSKIDELIRLQKEGNRIAEEESEARSLGISRKELIARREKQRQEEESNHQAAVRKQQEFEEWQRNRAIEDEERVAKERGISRHQLIAERKKILFVEQDRGGFKYVVGAWIIVLLLIMFAISSPNRTQKPVVQPIQDRVH